MNLNRQIAKHLRDVHFGGNWTVSNMKEHVAGLTWQQATTKVHTFNTIAALVYHTGYYVTAALNVLEGGPLESKDEYSFDLPPVQSQEDWERLQHSTWTEVEKLAVLIEQLPDDKLMEDFTDPKYGNYYRNFHGIIEHTHYHLGQIVLIKKLVLAD
jgi:hypothetical protein